MNKNSEILKIGEASAARGLPLASQRSIQYLLRTFCKEMLEKEMKLKLLNHQSYATSKKRSKRKSSSDGPKMKTRSCKTISSSKNNNSQHNKINKSKTRNEEKMPRKRHKILSKKSCTNQRNCSILRVQQSVVYMKIRSNNCQKARKVSNKQRRTFNKNTKGRKIELQKRLNCSNRKMSALKTSTNTQKI